MLEPLPIGRQAGIDILRAFRSLAPLHYRPHRQDVLRARGAASPDDLRSHALPLLGKLRHASGVVLRVLKDVLAGARLLVREHRRVHDGARGIVAEVRVRAGRTGERLTKDRKPLRDVLRVATHDQHRIHGVTFERESKVGQALPIVHRAVVHDMPDTEEDRQPPPPRSRPRRPRSPR